MSGCVLKMLACRGLHVGPSKLQLQLHKLMVLNLKCNDFEKNGTAHSSSQKILHT